jgi:hypothetical protein
MFVRFPNPRAQVARATLGIAHSIGGPGNNVYVTLIERTDSKRRPERVAAPRLTFGRNGGGPLRSDPKRLEGARGELLAMTTIHVAAAAGRSRSPCGGGRQRHLARPTSPRVTFPEAELGACASSHARPGRSPPAPTGPSHPLADVHERAVTVGADSPVSHRGLRPWPSSAACVKAWPTSPVPLWRREYSAPSSNAARSHLAAHARGEARAARSPPVELCASPALEGGSFA